MFNFVTHMPTTRNSHGRWGSEWTGRFVRAMLMHTIPINYVWLFKYAFRYIKLDSQLLAGIIKSPCQVLGSHMWQWHLDWVEQMEDISTVTRYWNGQRWSHTGYLCSRITSHPLELSDTHTRTDTHTRSHASTHVHPPGLVKVDMEMQSSEQEEGFAVTEKEIHKQNTNDLCSLQRPWI